MRLPNRKPRLGDLILGIPGDETHHANAERLECRSSRRLPYALPDGLVPQAYLELAFTTPSSPSVLGVSCASIALVCCRLEGSERRFAVN